MYRQMLSDLGSYASLISLVLTIYIAWSLRKIRNTYIFRVRAPGFVKVLGRHASTLIEYGNNFDTSQHQISIELIKIDVRVIAIQRRLRG